MSDESKKLEIAGEVVDLWTRGKLHATTEEAFKSDTDLAIVVCSPAGMSLGAVQARCGCGAIIWVSVQAQIAIKTRADLPTRLICLLCFKKDYGKQIEAANG